MHFYHVQENDGSYKSCFPNYNYFLFMIFVKIRVIV